ncbi:MAG: 4-hydroxybutyryl-CoA dehydratase [Candidatus Abyssobacteria bacterium SURF_5]|uniref:4-hydroxybutyryl-CoA dehydratase n=1 Tax=Abyssobacteria bacterium (strain SURF_5) TaxID=2093360 RepID=A0A3A4N8Q4_ABYX5|nr:MAG: 4-hydroxybutyryl-CoA dehydratase [Candidatus Abyssubacteria bacterium SURF_5]
MMTSKEYMESLRSMRTKVYAFGEKIEDVVSHPATAPHVRCAAMTYGLAHSADGKPLLTAQSHLTGDTINRFLHIHQSAADLITKVKMLRFLSQKTGSCYQRCVGFDGINAVYSTTYEIDSAKSTDYHQRFIEYLKQMQRKDLMICGAMTDSKGNRSLPPHQQPDPDVFVHVTERRKDGIVIRGSKQHQTGAVNSHEVLLMPTIALREPDKDFAVCCAVPADAPGVTMVFGRQANDYRKLFNERTDMGNPAFGIVGGEAIVILEDVFVPWERVFMCGEYEFAGMLVERFAAFHRQNYGACKGGVSDIIIGATALAAEMNGVEKASHVRDKLVEMMHLTETLYCCSIACSCEGTQTKSGSYLVDPLLANICKHNVTRLIYEIGRLSHDIAGGLIATIPSEKDFRNEEIGDLLRKHYAASSPASADDRVRVCRLIENMTAGTALVESMHGAGSPQAQRVMIYRQGNLEQKKNLARVLCGIK